MQHDNFEVLLIERGELLDKALTLRQKVFFNATGSDRDEFDKFCTHIVAIEKNTKAVVGTYRLLLGSVAAKNVGFYSETEFDLSNIKKNCRGQLLEMGRACVDLAYRRYPIINLMWNKILSYINDNKVKYVLGCASVDNPSPENIGKIFKFLKEAAFSTEAFRVYPLEGKKYPYSENIKSCSTTEALRLMPSLIKSYLKIGAVICAEPVWDKIFNTADFFMLLDMKRANLSYI
jgi:putative hemolysin